MIVASLLLQEREEATKVYGTLEQQQQAGNTFEPGEGLPEPAAAADGADGEEAAADGAEDAAAADAAAKPTAAPTAEQLTAIKAAVANAQTLEDAWRLEQSLKAGDMPSALERKEQLEQQQQQQQQDGSAAMEEG
jgi:U2 small nuclear ribonucleoprotein A'